MKAVIAKTTKQQVKVNNAGGGLQSQTPITLKNQITEINSIEDIADVAEIDVTTGATLIYNSANDKYEVRKLEAGDIEGDINMDGGVF